MKSRGGAPPTERTMMIDIATVSKKPAQTKSTKPVPKVPTPLETYEPPEEEYPEPDPTPPPLPEAFDPPARDWQPFHFTNLEKVSKAHLHMLRRLEWLLPNVRSTGEVSESVKKRLVEMLDEKVSLNVESVHVVHPSRVRRYVSDPTFLAVLAPLPNKTRGLLEVELGLAHMAIDMLLGGAGEAVALRPLTDIEEGVLTYVLIETLKAMAPSIDPQLPKLRIENVVRSFDDALAVLGEDENLAVVQLKAVFGSNSGYVRLFIPEGVLSMANPPTEASVRRARRSADAEAHGSRLSNVKVWLRAAIGQVGISAGDLAQLRERDVVLVDSLSARPDKGEGGTATLHIGLGRTGQLNAEISVEEGRFLAKITELEVGAPAGGPTEVSEPEPPAQGAELASDEPPPDAENEENHVGDDEHDEDDERTALGDGDAESTGALRRHDVENPEGADMLNDIPLQIAVELGRVAMSAEEVVALKVGHVLDLNRTAGEPLDLSVNGKIVARGELVEIDGNLGIRILSLAG